MLGYHPPRLIPRLPPPVFIYCKGNMLIPDSSFIRRVFTALQALVPLQPTARLFLSSKYSDESANTQV